MQTTALLEVVLIVGALQVSTSGADRPPGRAAVEVPVSTIATKQFENVTGLLEQSQWEAAIDAISRIRNDSPDVLVEAAPGHFLNADAYGQWMLSRLPVEGLATLRQQHDAWAVQRYHGESGPDSPSRLQQIVTTAFASSVGDDALFKLGEWYWEQGDIPQARRCWLQLLVPERGMERPPADLRLFCPDSSIAREEVVARLMLCHLAEQNFERAQQEFTRLGDLNRDDPVWFAGREGPLKDIATEVIAAEGEWARTLGEGDWATFARRSSRNGAITSPREIAGPVWTIPLTPKDMSNWTHRRQGMEFPAPATRVPVVWDGLVIFHDGRQIRAVRGDDGHPAWPTGQEEDTGVVYPPFPVHLPPLPWPPAGMPRFTSSIEQGLLVARLGPPIVSSGQSEFRLARRPWIVGLEMGREQGGLLWQIDDHDLLGANWLLVGTPVLADQRLYVALVRSHPEHEFGIAAFDTADGSPSWETPLLHSLREVPAGLTMYGSILLSAGEGLIFAGTNDGAIAAIDARTGVAQWVVTYPSRPMTLEDLSEEQITGLLPPLYAAGQLFVKPNDSDELISLDARSGTVLWRRKCPGRITHLLGISGTRLIVSGDQLWAVDSDDGSIQWRFGLDDPAAYGYGQGAIAATSVFWPTRDDLWVVDSHTGKATRRIPLREGYGISGGHIVLGGNRLLISGPNHITAFELRSDQHLER